MILSAVLLASCSPKNVPTDAWDTGSEETGEPDVPEGPSFQGMWEANEIRFEILNGGFDENGNVIPEGKDYETTLPAIDFCIEKWHLTVLVNHQATLRISYVNSSECTGGVEKADYVEESQWMIDTEARSIYVHPTQVEGDTSGLPDPYYLTYRWYSGDGGFDLGVAGKDFDGDGFEDDSQFLVYWRDLDG